MNNGFQGHRGRRGGGIAPPPAPGFTPSARAARPGADGAGRCPPTSHPSCPEVGRATPSVAEGQGEAPPLEPLAGEVRAPGRSSAAASACRPDARGRRRPRRWWAAVASRVLRRRRQTGNALAPVRRPAGQIGPHPRAGPDHAPSAIRMRRASAASSRPGGTRSRRPFASAISTAAARARRRIGHRPRRRHPGRLRPRHRRGPRRRRHRHQARPPVRRLHRPQRPVAPQLPAPGVELPARHRVAPRHLRRRRAAQPHLHQDRQPPLVRPAAPALHPVQTLDPHPRTSPQQTSPTTSPSPCPTIPDPRRARGPNRTVAMDRLVVMERGRVVERATRAAPVGAGGLHARLWRRRSGGFPFAEPAA